MIRGALADRDTSGVDPSVQSVSHFASLFAVESRNDQRCSAAFVMLRPLRVAQRRSSPKTVTATD